MNMFVSLEENIIREDLQFKSDLYQEDYGPHC